jgi:hypothetical protein
MQIRDPHLHHEAAVGIVVDTQHHDVLAFKRRSQHRSRLAAERLIRFRRVDLRHPEIHDNALDPCLESIAVSDADDTAVENFIVAWRRSLLAASRCAFLRRWSSMTVPLAGTFMKVTAVLVYGASVTECGRAKQEPDDEQRRVNREMLQQGYESVVQANSSCAKTCQIKTVWREIASEPTFNDFELILVSAAARNAPGSTEPGRVYTRVMSKALSALWLTALITSGANGAETKRAYYIDLTANFSRFVDEIPRAAATL